MSYHSHRTQELLTLLSCTLQHFEEASGDGRSGSTSSAVTAAAYVLGSASRNAAYKTKKVSIRRSCSHKVINCSWANCMTDGHSTCTVQLSTVRVLRPAKFQNRASYINMISEMKSSYSLVASNSDSTQLFAECERFRSAHLLLPLSVSSTSARSASPSLHQRIDVPLNCTGLVR